MPISKSMLISIIVIVLILGSAVGYLVGYKKGFAAGNQTSYQSGHKIGFDLGYRHAYLTTGSPILMFPFKEKLPSEYALYKLSEKRSGFEENVIGEAQALYKFNEKIVGINIIRFEEKIYAQVKALRFSEDPNLKFVRNVNAKGILFSMYYDGKRYILVSWLSNMAGDYFISIEADDESAAIQFANLLNI
ncbi:MAG: hypothetical protein HY929_01440 [Euryarchaeota archaeon]|nr:hypothetical protein [Euryarchaeota archaeon]